MKRKSRNPIADIMEILSGTGETLNIISKMMVTTMYEDLQQDMVKALQEKITAATDQETQVIDEDYAVRLACATYYTSISMPYRFVMMLGGPINVAWNLMHQEPEKCSPAAMFKMFQEGFGELSPTMAAAATEAVIVKTAKLLLWDWMTMGEPSEESYRADSHFYFHEVIELHASPDAEAVRREGYQHVMNMSPEDLADIDPELIEIVRSWKAENDKTND